MQPLKLFPGADYEFEYTNHAGETELRKAQFIDAHFGLVEGYYPTSRLLFHMFAYDRQAERSFDPANINFATWRQLSMSYGEDG
jgi:hypothetical protein